MFQWLFPPSCPCDPAAKKWVEERLQWLSGKFDDHAFNGRRVVLPTPEFFPDRYDESELAIRTMFDRVCRYMDVDPNVIDLEFFSNPAELLLVNRAGHYYPQTAGTFEEIDGRRFIIRLDKSHRHNPIILIGTIAHELAHVRLMGEGRIWGDEYDNELLTDLTVVFLGMGLFLANEPRSWESQNSKWPKTRVKRPKYMNSPMFGYAFGHLAWFQGIQHPAWAKHLTSTARTDFKQASRFLFKTGESDFKPYRFRGPAIPPA